MAVLEHAAHEIGVVDVDADDEKRGAHLVGAQGVEEFGRGRVVGAVVKGHDHVFGGEVVPAADEGGRGND